MLLRISRFQETKKVKIEKVLDNKDRRKRRKNLTVPRAVQIEAWSVAEGMGRLPPARLRPALANSISPMRPPRASIATGVTNAALRPLICNTMAFMSPTVEVSWVKVPVTSAGDVLFDISGAPWTELAVSKAVVRARKLKRILMLLCV